jgi:hypothetical protein
MATSKKRVIKSLETLSDDLKELLKDQYPTGYEGSITRITNAKKEPIFVFPLETEDATYLIKVPAVKNSDGEYDVKKEEDEFGDNAPGAGDSEDDYGSGNDNDNDDSYGSGGDSDDDYEGGGKRGNKEASYDPDFD